MSNPTDICSEMQEVRCRLGDAVDEIVQGAQTLRDWRHYVRIYPWLTVVGAAAVGYLIVPKRVEIMSPSVDTLEELAKKNKLVIKSGPDEQAKGGMSGAIVALLTNALIRGAIGYVGQNYGKFLNGGRGPEQQQQQPPAKWL